MVPGSLGWGSAVLAAIAMFAPSAAARTAMARPIPRDAPVMNTVLPASVPGTSPPSELVDHAHHESHVVLLHARVRRLVLVRVQHFRLQLRLRDDGYRDSGAERVERVGKIVRLPQR